MTRHTPPPLDVDYTRYEQLKREGVGAAEACRVAVDDGKDFAFRIRMLRSVFELDFVEARNIVGGF